MGWVVQSLGFDQERLGQPGFFLGWDRRMPRKAQVVFGRPTSANESFTARTWRNDVWAPAKLTWGLARLVFFFSCFLEDISIIGLSEGLLSMPTISLLRRPFP